MVESRRRRASAKAEPTSVVEDATNRFNAEVKQQMAQSVGLKAIKLPAQQPRRYFDEEKLEQLTASVKQYGILEPLIVRPVGKNRYELVAGERRYRAAAAAGLKQVPVTVHELTDEQVVEIALLENLQRDDLNPIDETEGLLDLLCQRLRVSREAVISLLNRAANAQKRGQELTDNDIRQLEEVDGLFKTVGRLSRESFRTNRLPLLNLPGDVLDVLREGRLEYTKAKVIARVADEKTRQRLMEQAIEEKLSLREVKQLIEELASWKRDSSHDIQKKLKDLLRTKSNAWKDASKQERLMSLIEELGSLLINC
jgi:ParB family transcriptional regulator, chromosome partitioning protein